MKNMTFRPVANKEWADMKRLFSEPGVQKGCWCMYWRIKRSEFNRGYGQGNEKSMKNIIRSGKVPGILAYQEGKPIGWCSIAPRKDFSVLDRSPTLKKIDDKPVWSIVCFFISKKYRRRKYTSELIKAAIKYAGKRGARIIESYPYVPDEEGGKKICRWELYTGIISTFKKLGFKVASRRSKRRPIMRYYLTGKQKSDK